jgi:hypothetical protein
MSSMKDSEMDFISVFQPTDIHKSFAGSTGPASGYTVEVMPFGRMSRPIVRFRLNIFEFFGGFTYGP